LAETQQPSSLLAIAVWDLWRLMNAMAQSGGNSQISSIVRLASSACLASSSMTCSTVSRMATTDKLVGGLAGVSGLPAPS
jgi:hypothetical protein